MSVDDHTFPLCPTCKGFISPAAANQLAHRLRLCGRTIFLEEFGADTNSLYFICKWSPKNRSIAATTLHHEANASLQALPRFFNSAGSAQLAASDSDSDSSQRYTPLPSPPERCVGLCHPRSVGGEGNRSMEPMDGEYFCYTCQAYCTNFTVISYGSLKFKQFSNNSDPHGLFFASAIVLLKRDVLLQRNGA